MNTLKTIILGLLMASTSIAFAQGGKNPKPISPELLAKGKKAHEARMRGKEFLKNNLLDEAIAAFREAVVIEDTYGFFSSSGNFELAMALTAAGRTQEALATYQKAILWDPGRKDLHVNGPPFIQLVMDYAILLAMSGKEQEAKSVYYYGLRNFNPHAESMLEPFPFLVVFDPDPDMTVWVYTPERLVTAAKMAKASFSGGQESKSLLEEVRQMEPAWIVPIVFQAGRWLGPKRAELLDLAMILARNDDEREWVQGFHFDDLPQENGVRIRKASTVLNAAKLDLELNHHKIAVCECEGGH